MRRLRNASATVLFAILAFCVRLDAEETKAAGPSEGDIAARRAVSRAKDLLEAQHGDTAVKMLEGVLEQYPKSSSRNEVYLLLGKYYVEAHQDQKGIQFLTLLSKDLSKSEEKLSNDDKEMHAQSLYFLGLAQYGIKDSDQALTNLRKLTTSYPNSIWTSQAYYYIGMCHFMSHNWSRAIEALNLVGTAIDPDSPGTEYVEAGRRFYVKIQDGDLPVLHRMGKEVKVELETKSGDHETITCTPLMTDSDTYIGSIATQIGTAVKDNHQLEVIGGDVITVKYVDENTEDGQHNVIRESKVQVVSTGTLTYTLGSFDTRATAAYLGQPLFVLLNDLDKDTSPQADEVQVKIQSRYKVTDDDASKSDSAKPGEKKTVADISDLDTPDVKYKVRDEAVLTLKEIGTAPVHTGQFGGSVKIERFIEGQPVQKTAGSLLCALDDEIEATYVDELHINGKSPRTVKATVTVVGEIQNRPSPTQYDPPTAELRAKTNLVEAKAYLELGQIFKMMGLVKEAGKKCEAGLDQIDQVIRTQEPIPTGIKEDAYSVKWNLLLVKDDFGNAIATCRNFNKLYPQSPLVDQALMSIARIKFETQKFDEAINIFREIQSMPNSQVKAEAQFNIAKAYEMSPLHNKDQAIEQYKLCAEKFPDSPYAGESLGKIVDFFVSTKDYNQANELLERVFQDYPDAKFLDRMLKLWVQVAWGNGDFKKAYDKATQLLSDYPSSKYAEMVRSQLPRIEQKLKK